MPSHTLRSLPQADPGQGDRLMARKHKKQNLQNPEWMELLQIEREERAQQEQGYKEYEEYVDEEEEEGVQNMLILENAEETPPSTGMAGYFDTNDENLHHRINSDERPGAPLYDKDGLIDTVAGSYFDKREAWQKAMEVDEPWRPQQDALRHTANSTRFGTANLRDTVKTMARTLPLTLRKQLTMQRKKDAEAAYRFQQELDERDAHDRYRMEHVKLRRIQIRERFQNRVLQRLQLEQKSLTAPTVSRGQLSHQRRNHDDIHEQRFEKEAHRLWWHQAKRMQQRKKLKERQQERERMEEYCNTMFHRTKRSGAGDTTLRATSASTARSTQRPQSPASPTRADHLMAEMDTFEKRLKQEKEKNLLNRLDDL